jgi:hypothetical protein
MSICLGDMRPGATFTASVGTTINYNNMCFAENEENNPWKPFSVRKGFKAGESTVSLFRGWNVSTMNLGGAQRMLEVMKTQGGPFGGSFTFVCDPLVAKSLAREGYTDPMKLSEWLTDQLNPRFKNPAGINFLVAGGEMNPMWTTTDFNHFQTVSIDPWIPKAGVKKDAKPLRMPAAVVCKDGSCGIGHG